ncbi:MAG TPA: adenylate kinase [Candidatus Limnocylindria bacterium]
MRTAEDLVLMGPPGVGKGTQARRLADRHGWVWLSTGEVFRDHQRRDTPLGRLVKGYLDRGEYVPDDATVGIVREFLDGVPAGARVMYDGFPRTVAQAAALDTLLVERGRAVGLVILLEGPRDELVRRMLARARAHGRSDDTLEVIEKRFDVYAEQTQPLVAYYERRGLLRRVDGLGSMDEVTARLDEATR